MLAAGVVEVLARGEYFNRLHSGPAGDLQQTGVQTMIQKQMR
jgi:hypothetical protein